MTGNFGSRRGYVKTNYQFCRLTTRRLEWILRKLASPNILTPPGWTRQRKLDTWERNFIQQIPSRQAQSLLAAWDQIDPSLAIGPVTSAALLTELDSARALKEEINRLQIKLLDLRNQRDELCIGIWDKVKRARSGIKGFYGDDSTEYEIAGGTRRAIGNHTGEKDRRK